jgi:hypothetical protein
MEQIEKKQKFIYLDADIHKELKVKAAQNDMTVGKYINFVLGSFLNKQN